MQSVVEILYLPVPGLFRQQAGGGDHGKLKQLIRPARGFQSLKTAYATIKGCEVMRMFRKGQFMHWIGAVGGGTAASFVNRLFGVYACGCSASMLETRVPHRPLLQLWA